MCESKMKMEVHNQGWTRRLARITLDAPDATNAYRLSPNMDVRRHQLGSGT